MNRLDILRFSVAGAFALAGLVPMGALAQSESSSPAASPGPAGSIAPPADTAPGASIDGVRDGWTLAANEDPTFSVQLPPGWTQGATTSGIAATSTAGEALTATPESLPDEADFDAWVTRVETDLETAAKDNLPTTFREVGTGVVARIDEGTSGGAPEGQVTAHFLFSLCAEGALTMDITGPAPAPTEGGAPDAWDDIASGVNPCAADPAPERVLDPELARRGAVYFDVVTRANAAANKAYEPIAVDTTLNVWRKQSAMIGRLTEGSSIDCERRRGRRPCNRSWTR